MNADKTQDAAPSPSAATDNDATLGELRLAAMDAQYRFDASMRAVSTAATFLRDAYCNHPEFFEPFCKQDDPRARYFVNPTSLEDMVKRCVDDFHEFLEALEKIGGLP